MATVKKVTKAQTKVSEASIIEAYMNDCLENNHFPKSVYLFCKQHQIKETEFYAVFNSLEMINVEVWNQFLKNAIQVIEKDKAYEGYTDKNKLLTLYFTLFEILNLNRSYCVFALKNTRTPLENLKDLSGFKQTFKQFVTVIITTNDSNATVKTITKPIYSEGAWIQFLFLLKFWLEDTSKGFEKTDIAIEKSVNTVVDLLNTKALENLVDFGKFLFKEMKKN